MSVKIRIDNSKNNLKTSLSFIYVCLKKDTRNKRIVHLNRMKRKDSMRLESEIIKKKRNTSS